MKTVLAEWERRLGALTLHKKAASSSENFSIVLGYNVPVSVSNICEEQVVLDATGRKCNVIISVQICSRALSTLLFSLKLTESRGKYTSGIGKQHCDFRFSVMKNMFNNIQNNTFRLFKECSAASDDLIAEERR